MLDTAGPSGLGDRAVANSPNIVSSELEVPSQNQQQRPLPLEYLPGFQHLEYGSLTLIGGKGGVEVQNDLYSPAAMVDSNLPWYGQFGVKVKSNSDIDVIEFCGFLVMALTNSKNEVQYAISYADNIPYFYLGPNNGAYTNSKINTTTERPRLAAKYVDDVVPCLWMTFVEPGTGNLYVVRGYLDPDLVNQTSATGPNLGTLADGPIVWQATQSVKKSSGGVFTSARSPGFAAWDDHSDDAALVIVYVDLSSKRMGWAVQDNSKYSTFIDQGLIPTSIAPAPSQLVSPGLAFSPEEGGGTLWLAYSASGAFKSFSLQNLLSGGTTWRARDDIATTSSVNSQDIMLHQTASATYAVWYGARGWYMTYRYFDSDHRGLTLVWAQPPIITPLSANGAVPTVATVEWERGPRTSIPKWEEVLTRIPSRSTGLGRQHRMSGRGREFRG